MTMMKESMGKLPQRMETLDKLWGMIPEEEDATKMADMGKEMEEDLLHNNAQTTKTLKMVTVMTTTRPN